MQQYAIIQQLELMAVRKNVKPLRREDSVNPFFRFLKTPRIFIPLVIVIVFGLLYYFRGLFIVALVNGQPISRIAVVGELEKRNGKQALEALIIQTLILQESQKRNIAVSSTEINSLIKKIEDGLKKQGQNLNQALSIQGMTRVDLESQLRIQKLVEKMVSKDVKVTDKEVSDYIEKNKATIPENLKADEATKAARQQLEQQKLSLKAQSLIEDLQSKAKINYFVNY